MAPSHPPTQGGSTDFNSAAAKRVARVAARSVWDPDTQEEHGGQTWRQLGSKFVCDFSVTTNAHGPPESAVEAAKEALGDISHYPAADCRQALAVLGEFTNYDPAKMLLSNGASEMIDVLMRMAPEGAFMHSPYAAGYMEYCRAAKVHGRTETKNVEESKVAVVIRPNSPTGDHMSKDELRGFVQKAGGVVVVDESFIGFLGPEWREESALGLIEEFPDKLIVLFSWTKLWACPGIRVGSVAASSDWITKIKSVQTPWSCNTLAQQFLIAAIRDTDYLKNTWETVPKWRRSIEAGVAARGWKLNTDSPPWVPWVFFECDSETEAVRAVEAAYKAGCPVRHCKSFGIPKCIRLGVRKPVFQETLFNAWEAEFGNK